MAFRLLKIFGEGSRSKQPAIVMPQTEIVSNLTRNSCINSRLPQVQKCLLGAIASAYAKSQTAFGLSFGFKLTINVSHHNLELYYPKLDERLFSNMLESRAKLNSLKSALQSGFNALVNQFKYDIVAHYQDWNATKLIHGILTTPYQVGMELKDVWFEGGNEQFRRDLSSVKNEKMFFEEKILGSRLNLIEEYHLREITVLYKYPASQKT